MNGDPNQPDDGEKTVMTPQPTERIAPAAPDEDAPTRIVGGRDSTGQGKAAETPQDATRILPRNEPATVLVDRGDRDVGATAPTRMLSPSGAPASNAPATHVSMPHANLPSAPPSASPMTSVSIPAGPVLQVQAPRTGQSATPSSARTAGSAADRDELPKTGEFIKERFELVQELGRGGMGAVFRARDMRKMEALDPDPFVAIKFISGSLIGFERAFVALQREAKNAQALNHPNIVKVFDFDRDGSLVYLTMEVVEGVALHSRLRATNANPLTPKEREHLIHGMLAGMSYAHLRDLSHADLKPSNMMIDANGDLKILDFGIARRREYDTVFDADDLFALTIDYASPEMLNRQRPTPADDVYALGCIIYSMHAGAHPFNHVRADVARNEKMKLDRPASLTRVQWQALRKALSFTREQRFADAAEFQRAYEAPDWRKLGGIAAAVLSALLVVAWFAADPIQSWMTVSGLDSEQAATLERSLTDGSEYLAGGYAEDAVYAFAEALTLDSHNAKARDGAKSAFATLRSRMQAEDFRNYLQSQQVEERNPAWLKDLAAAELAAMPKG
jgi:hypothetical protein